MTDRIRDFARMEKINQATEEVRRQRKQLENTAGAATVMMNQLDPALEARIRRLTPISQLPYHYQDNVIRQGDVLSFPRGSRIFLEGSEDEYVYYLLEGAVAMLLNGVATRHFSANSEPSAYPLDEGGKERTSSALVEEPAKVFRIKYAALDREMNLAETAPPPNPDEVLDITQADPSDWIVVTLRDGLFANLPVETIQRVLARVEEIEVSAGQVILEQGDPADYFYLVKEGSTEVNRKASANSVSVHLADIKAGGGFGEEALIADSTRNATVTMTSDGVLMKLTREDFNSLIRDPLLRSVSFDQAEQLVAADSVWIDARDDDRFAVGAMPGAINVPVSLLRLKDRELDPDKNYVIYSDNPSTSAVAAFLLSSRGLHAQYVREAVYPPLAESPAMPEQAEPVLPEAVTIKRIDAGDPERYGRNDEPVTAPSTPDRTEIAPADPEFYSDTLVGQGLASLVEEIRSDNEQIATRSVADPGETTMTGTTEFSLDNGFFDLEFGQSQPDPGVADSPRADSLVTTEHVANDWISSAFKDLENTFREQMETVRAQEHARAEQFVQVQVARVQKRAQQLIREKLLQARARDKERLKTAEEQLRERYDRLERVVNKITHQKAEIQRARRQIEQKLSAAGELYRELSTIGQTMTEQFDNLEEIVQDEGAELSG